MSALCDTGTVGNSTGDMTMHPDFNSGDHSEVHLLASPQHHQIRFDYGTHLGDAVRVPMAVSFPFL